MRQRPSSRGRSLRRLTVRCCFLTSWPSLDFAERSCVQEYGSLFPYAVALSRVSDKNQHSEHESRPRSGVRYRCHVCRLELVLNLETDTLAVVSVGPDESNNKARKIG